VELLLIDVVFCGSALRLYNEDYMPARITELRESLEEAVEDDGE
jgi:hypothetical protein